MESLYFIAILPPPHIQDQITGFKEEIAEQYGSRHALKSPPHITLHMPFRWKDKKFDQLKMVMNKLNEELIPFSIELKNFDFFEPKVIFVDVCKNEELFQLQKRLVDMCRRELRLDNANYKNRPFHPHVTIGFRDLRKSMFYEAMKSFDGRSYSSHFQVDQIQLLKHDGVKWNIITF